MSKCDWCGKVITGEPIMNIHEACLLIKDDNTIVKIIPEFRTYFCSSGCTWAFFAEAHMMMGLSGKDLRNHFTKMHGFSYPPGKAAGGMRRDCLIVDIALSMTSILNPS